MSFGGWKSQTRADSILEWIVVSGDEVAERDRELFAGRVRTLCSRLGRGRRDLEIPFRRLPLSLLFLTAHAAAFERGRRLALLGRPKPKP